MADPLTLPVITESPEELDRLVTAERNAQVRRRLHLLLLIRSGQVESRTAAAAHLAVHRNTIRDWLLRYESGDLERLSEIKQGAPDQGFTRSSGTRIDSFADSV
ncbi:MAG TPA: helix-turn-helix domain-containing protein [Longimicrobium sp.]|uniref:helix-turn-helix domain-containing protein n=1 Tax=Longimicrobium sp. TaxID=2029185 RepID=UPI002EDA9001